MKKSLHLQRGDAGSIALHTETDMCLCLHQHHASAQSCCCSCGRHMRVMMCGLWELRYDDVADHLQRLCFRQRRTARVLLLLVVTHTHTHTQHVLQCLIGVNSLRIKTHPQTTSTDEHSPTVTETSVQKLPTHPTLQLPHCGEKRPRLAEAAPSHLSIHLTPHSS